MRLYCLGIIALLFSACSSKQTVREKETQERKLFATQIPIAPVIDPENMVLAGDYLVTCSSRCDTILTFFKQGSLEYQGGKGIIGGGPNDYIMPWLYNGLDENLYVRGFGGPNIIGKFSMQGDVYKLIKEYKPAPDLFCTNFGTVIQGERLVGYKQAPSPSILVYSMSDNKMEAKREFASDKDENQESYYQENRGIPAASGQNTVAYAYRFKNRIDFFSLDERNRLKDIQTVEGELRVPDETNRHTQPEQYYINVIATRDKYYALFRKGDKKQDVLEVYTATGEPIVTYTFDIAPLLYCVDEDKGLLYGYRYDMPDTFLLYQL